MWSDRNCEVVNVTEKYVNSNEQLRLITVIRTVEMIEYMGH